MKIISLMHENMNLSSKVEDYLERTNKNSTEKKWTRDFLKRIESYPCSHNSDMLKEINELILDQNAVQLTIKEFYNNFPELIKRYSYLDVDNILEDGYIYSQVAFNLFNKDYLFKYKVSDQFDFLKIKSNKERLEKKDSLLSAKVLDYKLEVYKLGDNIYKIFDSDDLSNYSPKLSSFLQNIEYILELDNLSLSNFLEKNPAVKHYSESRHIIPQILTRCRRDSLILPVTDESVNVYETLLTQKKIYKIKTDIKINKFK